MPQTSAKNPAKCALKAKIAPNSDETSEYVSVRFAHISNRSGLWPGRDAVPSCISDASRGSPTPSGATAAIRNNAFCSAEVSAQRRVYSRAAQFLAAVSENERHQSG
jgi:hypothetical protein